MITAEYRVWPARRKLLTMNVPVVLAGDYNVAPTGLDICSTTSWDDDALVQPPSRAAYAMLVKQGWTVAFRKCIRTTGLYVRALFVQTDGSRKLACASITTLEPVTRASAGGRGH